jgi:hypothetical protein
VRILPRVAFGAHPGGLDGLAPDSPDVVVLHHYLGSWQSKGHGWGWLSGGGGGGGGVSVARRRAMQILSPLVPAGWVRESGGDGDAPPPPGNSGVELFPVSASFDPPFTVFTHLAGAGDAGGGGADVGAEVTRYGGYQPALLPSRSPSVVDALVGSLGPGAARAGEQHMPLPAAGSGAARGVFVDVGAGEGFFALAAAARGHRVIAFEAAAPSLRALRAGIAYNGFEGLVEVVDNVTLGAREEVVCLPRRAGRQAGGGGGGSSRGGGGGEEDAAPAPRQQRRARERRLREAAARLARGYPHLADLPPEPRAGAGRGDSSGDGSGSSIGPRRRCPASAPRALRRTTLAEFLGARRDVATLRIAAHGHEGWVLQGLLPYLTKVHRPAVVYFEFAPAAMRAAGYPDPAAPLRQLRALGYADAAHAGRVCDGRWSNVTGALRAQVRGGVGARRCRGRGAAGAWHPLCFIPPRSLHALTLSQPPPPPHPPPAAGLLQPDRAACVPPAHVVPPARRPLRLPR